MIRTVKPLNAYKTCKKVAPGLVILKRNDSEVRHKVLQLGSRSLIVFLLKVRCEMQPYKMSLSKLLAFEIA